MRSSPILVWPACPARHHCIGQVLLLAVACLALLASLPATTTASGGWIKSASEALANATINLTTSALQSYSPQFPDAVGNISSGVEGLRSQYIAVIQQDLAKTAGQRYDNTITFHNRFQLDVMAIAPKVLLLAENYQNDVFNKPLNFTIFMTAPPRTLLEASFTQVTVADAGIRWTDHTGGGGFAVRKDDASVINHPWFLFYRRDAFATANLTAPETWDQLLAAAKKLNGTDFDGDGQKDFAVCFNAAYYCQPSFILMMMYGPMVQVRLERPGMLFDLDSMAPRVENAAMGRALEMFAELMKYNSPASQAKCYHYDTEYSKGKCAMTLNFGQFEHWNTSAAIVQRNFGISQPPGSSYVLDTQSNTLVLCTPTLCPLATASSQKNGMLVNYAPLHSFLRIEFMINPAMDLFANVAFSMFWNYYTVQVLNGYSGMLTLSLQSAALTPSLPSNSCIPADANSSFNITIVANSTDLRLAQGSPVGAPTGATTTFAGAAGTISASGPPTSAAGTISASGPPTSAAAPPPGSPSSPALPFNPWYLDSLGLNPNLTIQYLNIYVGMIQHPNRLGDPNIPGMSYYRSFLAEAALRASEPEANISRIMRDLTTSFEMTTSTYSDLPVLLSLYQLNMGYTPPPPPPPTKPSAPRPVDRSRLESPEIISGMIIPSVVVALACVVLVTYMRTRDTTRTLLGAIIPPGAGPSTTLLITDIQNSTTMWEQLPMELMEEVLRVHHSTLRGLLDKHGGYESATEGDSFILAFHHPRDALAYAAAAQRALLEAAWPEQLLASFQEAAVQLAHVVASESDAELSFAVKRMQDHSRDAHGHVIKRIGNATSSRVARRRSTRMDHDVQYSHRQHPHLSQVSFKEPTSSAPAASSRWGQRLLSWLNGWKAKHTHEAAASSTAHPSPQDAIVYTMEAIMSAASSDSGSSHRGEPKGCSFGWAISQAWVQVLASDPPPYINDERLSHASHTVWRGVRVRMGIHSGLEDPSHATFNAASHRMQYSGEFAAAAKYVVDAGHGGQVLLSHAAFSQLSCVDAVSCVLLMGEYQLAEAQPSQPLYQAVLRGLEPRLQSFPPLKTKQLMAEGVLQAPVGMASVAFMNVTGLQALLAWNSDVTRTALSQYHTAVSAQTARYSGYVAEMVDGLSLVVFQRPEYAIAWALACRQDLLQADWAEELLQHELCEPIYASVLLAGEGDELVSTQRAVSRGLRLKVGIDTGVVIDSINSTTGRMAYRGRVMNRAARICSAATSGQVFCDAASFGMVQRSSLMSKEGIMLSSAGFHSLKGIGRDQELFSCRYMDLDHVVINSSGRSQRRSSRPLPTTAAEDAAPPFAVTNIHTNALYDTSNSITTTPTDSSRNDITIHLAHQPALPILHLPTLATDIPLQTMADGSTSMQPRPSTTPITLQPTACLETHSFDHAATIYPVPPSLASSPAMQHHPGVTSSDISLQVVQLFPQ